METAKVYQLSCSCLMERLIGVKFIHKTRTRGDHTCLKNRILRSIGPGSISW